MKDNCCLLRRRYNPIWIEDSYKFVSGNRIRNTTRTRTIAGRSSRAGRLDHPGRALLPRRVTRESEHRQLRGEGLLVHDADQRFEGRRRHPSTGRGRPPRPRRVLPALADVSGTRSGDERRRPRLSGRDPTPSSGKGGLDDELFSELQYARRRTSSPETGRDHGSRPSNRYGPAARRQVFEVPSLRRSTERIVLVRGRAVSGELVLLLRVLQLGEEVRRPDPCHLKEYWSRRSRGRSRSVAGSGFPTTSASAGRDRAGALGADLARARVGRPPSPRSAGSAHRTRRPSPRSCRCSAPRHLSGDAPAWMSSRPAPCTWPDASGYGLYSVFDCRSRTCSCPRSNWVVTRRRRTACLHDRQHRAGAEVAPDVDVTTAAFGSSVRSRRPPSRFTGS